jgi:hypothetical protein
MIAGEHPCRCGLSETNGGPDFPEWSRARSKCPIGVVMVVKEERICNVQYETTMGREPPPDA